MTTLLLPYVDPASRRALLARHGADLRARGLSLVLADDELAPEDRALFDDCVQLPAPAHVGAALDALLAYAARHRIDAVCPESEAGLLPGVLLAQRLGLRALSPRAALLTGNKWLSRRAMAAGGVPVPRFALAADAAGVRRFAAAHGWPVMLKAVSSCLSRNVVKVAREADADAAVARLHAALPTAPDVLRCAEFARLAGLDMACDPTREFLVEEFFDGEPLEVDGLVLGGAVASFGVTGQVLSAGPQFHIEAYLAPAPLPAATRAAAEVAALAALAALGVDDTGFSIELRARGERCVVIEVNGRLGQDDGFPELFARAIGSEPLLLWLTALADDAPLPPVRATGHHALAYVNHAAGGTFRGATARDRAHRAGRADRADHADRADRAGRSDRATTAVTPEAAATHGVDVRVLIAPGTRLAPLGDPHYDPHVVCALASDPASSAAALAAARAALARLDVRIDTIGAAAPAAGALTLHSPEGSP